MWLRKGGADQEWARKRGETGVGGRKGGRRGRGEGREGKGRGGGQIGLHCIHGEGLFPMLCC